MDLIDPQNDPASNYHTFMATHNPITDVNTYGPYAVAVYNDCIKTLTDPNNTKQEFGIWSENMIYIIKRIYEDPQNVPHHYTPILVRDSKLNSSATDNIKYYSDNCIQFYDPKKTFNM